MARRKPRLGDLVEIHWKDAVSDTGDFTLESLKKERRYVCNRKLIGYYIITTEGYVICASDVTFDLAMKPKEYSDMLSVPEEMVTGLRVVESSPQGKQTHKGHT